jgi:hypothetical protein
VAAGAVALALVLAITLPKHNPAPTMDQPV